MRKSGSVLLFLFFSLSLWAGDGEYAMSRIPAGLLVNANAVKRTEEMLFEITEGNRARYRHKVAYTILNEQGEKWAFFGEGYDKLRSIESFEGRLFDSNG